MKRFGMLSVSFVARSFAFLIALAGLFPLYQWTSEADDRALDRIATLAIAGEACDSWFRNSVGWEPGGGTSPLDSSRELLTIAIDRTCGRLGAKIWLDAYK
jgi:hypothetical protein